MSNTKLPALKDALDLLNQTQEVLGRFVANHRNPSEKDTISELLGLHDCAAGYAARKAVSETLALLADRERQAGEAVAYSQSQRETAYDLLDRKLRNTLNDADYAEMSGALECLFASLPAPQAVQAGWKLVPVEPTSEMWGELARDIVWWMYMSPAPHYGSKLHAHLTALGREIPDWLAKEIPNVQHTPPKGTVAACIYKAMLTVAPSPDGNAEQAEAPSDLSVLRRIHKLLVNQVRPALRSPVITKDVDDAAEALSALMSRTQTEAPSDSTLKLAEMILADCGHSTAISTRLRDRVAERIERHLAAQPTEASCRSTNADGHVLLPFEPTDEMEVAAEDAYEESGSPFPNWKAVYRAMRDASLTTQPTASPEQAEAPWLVVVLDPSGVERLRTPMTEQQAKEFRAAMTPLKQLWCDGCDPGNCAGCVRVKKGGAQ